MEPSQDNPQSGQPESKETGEYPPPEPGPPKQPIVDEPVDHFNTKIDPGDGSIKYLRSWTFIMDTPDWMFTWLLMTGVSIIPILGQIIVQGYLFNSFEGILRGYRTNLPEYRFDRFSEDLQRGIWPWLFMFVISAVMQLVLHPTLQALSWVAVGVTSNMDEESAILMWAILIPLMILAVMVFSVIGMVVTMPIHFRIGISQKFAEGFNFAWVKQFLSLMWFELLLVKLFVVVSGIIAGFAGFAVCCVGVVFVTTIAMVANMYLEVAIYKLFLLRGGEPIPLKAPVNLVAESWQET